MSTVNQDRETRVLGCLMDGMTNTQIAEHLGIMEHLVKKDVSVLLQRYNAKNRVGLVVGIWKAGQDKIGKTK